MPSPEYEKASLSSCLSVCPGCPNGTSKTERTDIGIFQGGLFIEDPLAGYVNYDRPDNTGDAVIFLAPIDDPARKNFTVIGTRAFTDPQDLNQTVTRLVNTTNNCEEPTRRLGGLFRFCEPFKAIEEVDLGHPMDGSFHQFSKKDRKAAKPVAVSIVNRRQTHGK